MNNSSTATERELLGRIDPELARWLADNNLTDNFFKAIRESGCAIDEQTMAELAAGFKASLRRSLSDDELDQVAGGATYKLNFINNSHNSETHFMQKIQPNNTDGSGKPLTIAWLNVKNPQGSKNSVQWQIDYSFQWNHKD